jgi:radical SAM superfamily enzyme YgiQ (UPF0313 family)
MADIHRTSDVVLVFPRTGSMDVKGILIEIPQSVLFLASCLIKEGFSVKIIDQRVEDNWKEILKKEAPGAKIIGISSMTGKQIHYGLEMARFVRKISKAKIVWGGIHPSIMPEQTAKHSLVDAVCIGEGEEAIIEMLRKDWKDVKGLCFKDKETGKLVRTEERKFLDMNKIPELAFHLLKMENYFIPFVGVKALHLHTSRGCPHRCAFCYNLIFNKSKWRAMDAKKVSGIIKEVVGKFKVGGIVFADDNFFVDLKRVEDIFKDLDKKNIQIRWKANVRIDCIDRMSEEFLTFLEEHGLDTLDIGVESGSDATLKNIQKDITAEQIYRVNKKLASRNIWIRYSFMMGMPNETESDRAETMKMIVTLTQQNKKAMIGNVAIFSPYPGCKMFNDVIQRGYLPPKSLEEWGNFSYTTTKLPFIDRKLSKKLENISHMSRFVDGRSVRRYLVKRPVMWNMANFYSKIVRYRWKKGFFTFMPELEAFKFVFNKGWIR